MTLRRVSGAMAPVVYASLVLGGCDLVVNGDKPSPNGDSGQGTTTTVEGGLVVQSVSGVSDNNGYFKLPVRIDEANTVLQAVGRRDGALSVDYLTDKRGNAVFDWEEWMYTDESLTECFYMSNYTTTLDWPVREVDGWLEPGDYEVWFATLSNQGRYTPGESISVDLLLRTDDDLQNGTLKALIAYADGVAEDTAVVSATEQAAEYWVELYGNIGITLEIEYTSVAMDAALPSSSRGDAAYQALAESLDERKVILVVGETIANDSWLYGEAGGIPGPFGPAKTGVVAVAWLANSGGDGTFSPEDVLLYGETMAHEMGHYLGLYHPVEDGFEYFDALADTERCTSYRTCEEGLGANLMYPYPICTGRTCSRQDQLTADQAGVAHRFIGVL